MMSIRDFKRSIDDFSENYTLNQQLYIAGTIGGAIATDRNVREIRDVLRLNRQKRNDNVPAFLRNTERMLTYSLRKA